MRKRIAYSLLIIFLALTVITLTGCQPEEEEKEEFDQAALEAVDRYIVEMGEALKEETLRADLKGWAREYYEDELPLYYDEERREWLDEHRENLKELKRSHLEQSDFPTEEEIVAWEVIVVRGEDEWLLEGEEVLSGLDTMNSLYDEMIAVLNMIIENEGELDVEQSERVLALLDDIEPAVEEARSVLRR